MKKGCRKIQMIKWKGVWFYWCQKDFSSMPAPLTASLWVGRRKATVQWPPKSKGGQFARWVWPSWELFCCRQQCWSRPASYLPALPPASHPLLVFACSPIWRSSAHNPSDCRMAPSGLILSSFSQSLLTKSRSVDFYSFHFIVCDKSNHRILCCISSNIFLFLPFYFSCHKRQLSLLILT